jgi:hypothetical protein
VKPRVYIETNFVVGYGKEHHRGQEAILSLASSGRVDLRLPAVAIMESYKSWERERERANRLRDGLQAEIADVLDRKFVPDTAREFTDSLSSAASSVVRRLDRARGRIATCVHVVASYGRILPLPTSWALIERDDSLILAEPDDMILASVIEDAKEDPDESILLTENSEDFAQPSVKDALQTVGVQYMYDTADALARIRSRLS